VARKAAAGEGKSIEPLEDAPAEPSNVIDLSELLRSSLRTRKGASAAKKTAPAKRARKSNGSQRARARG
jgi:non-homologous end joining protein Ku